MKIIKVAEPCIGQEEVKAVQSVILSGKYISGPYVKKFEDNFAEYLGVKYAVAVNSGTAALHVALAVLGIGPGDEVIVPPITFFSTVTAVLHQNAIPIFADIDIDSYCLDPQDVERKITKKTRAIIPVHFYGNSADMNGFKRISKKYNIKIIEDCAQAHGTEFRGKKVGAIGDLGCFSFFATKHMTTGEGGMITTNNKKWADLARVIRSHGLIDRDNHHYLGYNYRMNEIAAAMGIVQLKKLDLLNKKRINNSLYLYKKLAEANIAWLKLPKLEKYIKHTFFWFPVYIDEKKLGMKTKKLIQVLKAKGIETRNRYWEPLYKQKILVEKSAYPKGFPFKSLYYNKKIDYKKIYLKNVEQIAGKMVGLPNHPNLTKEELDKVAELLQNIKRG